MKAFTVFFVFAFIAYVSASAIPEAVYDGPTYELTRIQDSGEMSEVPVRARRLTCDLFSFTSQWLSVNHSACAAKCIAQRRRGGRCDNGICICR